MLLPKFLSRKISPEKSLDYLSEKSVVRPALNGILIRIRKKHIRIGNKFDCVEGVSREGRWEQNKD